MKFMPVLRTGVLATLVSVAPIAKALSQTADSTAKIPLIKFLKPNSMLCTAQSGIARNTYTAAVGIQLPKVFSVQPKGKEVFAGNLDFFGVALRRKQYSKDMSPSLFTRASLTIPVIGNNNSIFNMKIADVATFNLTAGESKLASQHWPYRTYGYSEQTELSNLLGPAATLHLGKKHNTKVMAMIGHLTSNSIAPALGYIVSVVRPIKGGLMGFIKAEKASSVPMVNAGIIYRPNLPK